MGAIEKFKEPKLQPFSTSIDWLRTEFIHRRKKNPAYSLRAFARQLDVSSGALSQILSKKRPLTLKQGKQFAEQLAYTPAEQQCFFQMIEIEGNASKATNFYQSKKDYQLKQLDFDSFHLIADWYHYGILNLMDTVDFQNDPSWIAKRLGITVIEVRAALDRLVRLELVLKTKNGYRPNQEGVTTSTDIPNVALKRLHRQSLERALSALDTVPVLSRDITLATVAIDPNKIKVAKEMIAKFRSSLCRFLGEGSCTEVYNLTIQLVPLTKLKEK